MSSRFGERGYGRFGGRYDEDDDDERTRYAREYDRGGSYGEGARRGYGLAAGRDYGSSRERDYEDYGSRGYGRAPGAGGHYTREYPSRYGREVTYYGGGGYTGTARGREYDYGEGGGRDYVRDYGRDPERGYVREPGRDYVRGGQDTDYGRTTSRFFGRDYERDDRDDRGRDPRGRERGGGDRGWVDRAADEVLSWFGDEDAERRRRMDDARGGRYRGRGPKNYRRSDERIQEEINDRLTEDDWLDASDIEVSVTVGEVILSGEVEGRRDKRHAEDIAASVSGVNNVQNNLRVRNWRAAGEAGGAVIAPADATGTGGLPTTVPTDETLTTTPPTGTATTGGTSSRAAKTTG